MMASIELWKDLKQELGVDLEVATPGGLLVAETDSQMREVARKADLERSNGLPVEMLDQPSLRRLAPYVSDRMIGGSFCPIEGKANPHLATLAFAKAATDRGARVMQHTSVSAIASSAAGFHVVTSRGPISCRKLVNCAGAASGAVAKLVGLDLPVEKHPIQVNVTEPTAPLVKHLLYFAGEKLTLKQTPLGALLIGGGWPSHVDPVTGRLSASLSSIMANLAVAQRVVPQVSGVQLLRTWPAIVNGTADWKPIIGEISGVPNFFMAMFPWMGFTAGPFAAKAIADITLGRDTGYDLSQFSAARYG